MTRKLTLLAILEAAGERGVTTAEILQAGVGSRYGARLLELRKDGYVIQGVREREGSWRYTLLTALDGHSNPQRPVESGAGGGLGVSAPACPASLFEVEVAPRSTAHWEGEAA